VNSIAEKIINLMARAGLLKEGIGLVNKGGSVADAERIIRMDRQLRRDIKRRGRRRWLDLNE